MTHWQLTATGFHGVISGEHETLVIQTDTGTGLRISFWERKGRMFYTIHTILPSNNPEDINYPCPGCGPGYELNEALASGEIQGE